MLATSTIKQIQFNSISSILLVLALGRAEGIQSTWCLWLVVVTRELKARELRIYIIHTIALAFFIPLIVVPYHIGYHVSWTVGCRLSRNHAWKGSLWVKAKFSHVDTLMKLWTILLCLKSELDFKICLKKWYINYLSFCYPKRCIYRKPKKVCARN